MNHRDGPAKTAVAGCLAMACLLAGLGDGPGGRQRAGGHRRGARHGPGLAGAGPGRNRHYFQVSLRVRVQALPVLTVRLPPDSQVTVEPFFFTYLYSTFVLAGRTAVPFQTG
jgi:hypothetical protein